MAVKELLNVKAKKARKAKLQPQQNGGSGQPTNQLMRKTVSVPTNMSNVSITRSYLFPHVCMSFGCALWDVVT